MTTAEELLSYYSCRRYLPDGRMIGIAQQVFTCGLFVGITDDGWSYDSRFCYHTAAEAIIAATFWDGQGDPPGNWIVEKPLGRQGPGSKMGGG